MLRIDCLQATGTHLFTQTRLFSNLGFLSRTPSKHSIRVELFLASGRGDMGSQFQKAHDLAARRIGLYTCVQ
jgi:hypothetical protein